MNNTEENLRNLAEKLKPNKNDKKQYGAAIDAVATVLRDNKKISVAEVWKCGSIGKNTGIAGRSDIDMVVLLSPNQKMANIFDLLKNVLKGSSTINLKSSSRAVQAEIRGIEMDILPTKYGMQGALKRAQNDNKLVSEIVGLGQIFAGTTRIIKYWRDCPKNAPKDGDMPSFGIEIIVAHVMRGKDYKTYTEVMQAFFEYVVSSELKASLPLYDNNNNELLTYDFDFFKKKNFINRSKYGLKSIKNHDLGFIDK